jgi:hypothetical protein
VFFLLWDVEWDRMSIQARYVEHPTLRLRESCNSVSNILVICLGSITETEPQLYPLCIGWRKFPPLS